MTKVRLNISVSLDGYMAGPDTSDEHPLGVHGELLHEWMFARSSASSTDESASADPAVSTDGVSRASRDAEPTAAVLAATGATVIGRRMFDVGAKLWGDVPVPGDCFVVTHHPAPPLPQSSGTFHFVTDGVAAAIEQALHTADHKDVWLMGGGDIIHQALRANLVDEIHVQVIGVLLGRGVRLFEDLPQPVRLNRIRVVETPTVTHLHYEVVR